MWTMCCIPEKGWLITVWQYRKEVKVEGHREESSQVLNAMGERCNHSGSYAGF